MTPSLTFVALWFFTAAPGDRAAFEVVTVQGKVVFMAKALKERGIEADRGPIEAQAALVAGDRSITPLISDEASRAFFLDDRMRDRRTEIVARRYAGLPYLQVLSFKVEEEGKLLTPEYYCDICAISVRYPQICPCCQGDMVLRMKPEGR